MKSKGGQPRSQDNDLPGRAKTKPIPRHGIGLTDTTVGKQPRISIRCINTTLDFDLLDGAWNELVENSDATIFQTFEWQRTWWEYFSGESKLHLLTFRDNDELVGLFPLALHRKRSLGTGVIKHLRFIGVGLSDYLSPIVARGREKEVIDYFVHHLLSNQGDWDIFDLEDVSESSPSLKLLASSLQEYGLPVFRYQGSVCPQISLPPRREEFMKFLGSSAAYNLKRKFKKLKNNFSYNVELIKSESDKIDQAIEDFSRIHAARWNNQGYPSAFDDPHHKSFHVEICKRFAEQGWLRMYFLRVNDQRVAVSLDFNFRSRIYMYQSNAHGPDDVMKCSPGLLIRSVAMEEGIDEGMHTFDFMRGNETYKYREGKAIDRSNWLIRTSSHTSRFDAKYTLFLLDEFFNKALSRLKREYYEYRRYRISGGPEKSHFRFFAGKISTLWNLAIEFFRRHLSSDTRSSMKSNNDTSR